MHRDDDLIRLGLQSAIIDELYSSDIWESEINALIALKDVPSALTLIERAITKDELEMMKRTIALAEKTQDSSSWAKRADQAKADIESALEVERAEFKKFPYSEETVQEALDILKRKANEKAAKEIERAVKSTEKAEKAEKKK